MQIQNSLFSWWGKLFSILKWPYKSLQVLFSEGHFAIINVGIFTHMISLSFILPLNVLDEFVMKSEIFKIQSDDLHLLIRSSEHLHTMELSKYLVYSFIIHLVIFSCPHQFLASFFCFLPHFRVIISVITFFNRFFVWKLHILFLLSHGYI